MDINGWLSHARHNECGPGDIRLNISIIVQSTLYASANVFKGKWGIPLAAQISPGSLLKLSLPSQVSPPSLRTPSRIRAKSLTPLGDSCWLAGHLLDTMRNRAPSSGGPGWVLGRCGTLGGSGRGVSWRSRFTGYFLGFNFSTTHIQSSPLPLPPLALLLPSLVLFEI